MSRKNFGRESASSPVLIFIYTYIHVNACKLQLSGPLLKHIPRGRSPRCFVWTGPAIRRVQEGFGWWLTMAAEVSCIGMCYIRPSCQKSGGTHISPAVLLCLQRISEGFAKTRYLEAGELAIKALSRSQGALFEPAKKRQLRKREAKRAAKSCSTACYLCEAASCIVRQGYPIHKVVVVGPKTAKKTTKAALKQEKGACCS